MPDPRAGKTYSLTWQQWVAYCAEHGLDPYEQEEDGYDLGGGDSFTIACYERPPKKSRIKPERMDHMEVGAAFGKPRETK